MFEIGNTILLILGIAALGCSAVLGCLAVLMVHRKKECKTKCGPECQTESSQDLERQRGVNIDLADLEKTIASGADTQAVYVVCKHYTYLTKVEGFSSVVTLFKHRHRARALKRLATFKQEWQENGLKLYDRI